MSEREFPFTESEWQAVKEASTAICNASLIEDDVLRRSRFVQLQVVLAALREIYGDHPVLLETEADFCDDFVAQCELYQRAIDRALLDGLPTYTVRLSFAQAYSDHGDMLAAAKELRAGEGDVARLGDSYEKATWAELLTLSERATPG